MVIRHIAVIGAGVMGSGVAQVSACAGYTVVVQDVSDLALTKAKASIIFSLGKLTEKGRLTREQADTALGNIAFVTDLKPAVEQADLIVEAVFESLAIKHEIFKKLDQLARPETIFASNTSALPITEIASVTRRGEQCRGNSFYESGATDEGGGNHSRPTDFSGHAGCRQVLCAAVGQGAD